MNKLPLGTPVTIIEGSGIDGGKQGYIVPLHKAPLEDRFRSGKQYAIKLKDSKEITVMFKSRVVEGHWPRFHEKISFLLPRSLR